MSSDICRRMPLTGEGRSLGGKISGGRGRPWGIFFVSYKTRHIFLSNGANCTVLHAVVLTQYRRVTDGQTDGRTDGIAVANTALAMRIARAVKTDVTGLSGSSRSVEWCKKPKTGSRLR